MDSRYSVALDVKPEQISLYRYVQGMHNDILAEAFSNKVVTPDVTTTDDVNWWLRHRYSDLHLDIDNHPSITVTRRPSKFLNMVMTPIISDVAKPETV